MGERRLTVQDRIIIHLAGYIRYADDFECPEEMSQVGISTAIAKSRAHTTLELNRMKGLDLITERLAHVKGAKSKRKTYVLATEALAKEKVILDKIWNLEIEVRDSDESKIMNGQQAAELLIKDMSIFRAMAFEIVLDSDGTIDIEVQKSKLRAEASDLHEPEEVEQTFDAHILQANILSKKNQIKEALAILDRAIENYSANPDISRVYYSRASIFRKQGDYSLALKEIDKSLDAAKDSEDSLMIGRCQMEKAMIMSDSGDDSQSVKLLDSSYKIFQQVNSQIDILRCGINQGKVRKSIGNYQEATNVLEHALDIAEMTGLDRLRAYAMVNLADLLNEQKEYERSRELAANASGIFQVLDEPLMLAASLFNLGEALAYLGEKTEAMTNLGKAIAILEKNGISRPGWLQHYAMILKELDEPEKAQEILNKINL